MRLLCLLCLGPVLFGQARYDQPEPGRDAAFVARVLATPEESGARPWHLLKDPPEAGSAVVEVVGELSEAEVRQGKFNEFLAWFQADLRKFMERYGDAGAPPAPAGMVSLARIRF